MMALNHLLNNFLGRQISPTGSNSNVKNTGVTPKALIQARDWHGFYCRRYPE